uniref:aldo/keto reductase n=1 Tax=Paractinoplanes polyasparticus TaxID=2856853 RepID=UPI0027DEB173|nr:aldo/keto reductase [Actinoplanes polyasparticus]
MITAHAAGTWQLGDQVVNRMGFGSMRLTANPDRSVAIRVLRRAVELGVNHISRTAPVAPRFEALAALRGEGLIRHLGISNATLAQIDEAAAVAPIVCVQNSFAVDLKRDAALPAEPAERGTAFVPFFAIAGPGREDGPTAGTDNAVREIAAAHHVTEHQIRLAWTPHQGADVLAIPGTGDEQHLLDNIAAGAVRLTAEDLARLG